MDMQAVLALLGAEREAVFDGDIYRRIRVWEDWWKGYHQPFHRFRELGKDGGIRERQLYSMKMAKKICEDWAGILLNERTSLTLEHHGSSRFLQGEDGQGGILESCRFWQRANALVEEAFYSGTGAFVLHLEGIRAAADGTLMKDEQARIGLQYLPAQNIIPLSVKNGEMVEAAFCSEALARGKKLLFLETHTLSEDGYILENRCFEEREEGLAEVRLPQGLVPRIETHSFLPLFAILRPNTVTTQGRNTGMGEAIFAGAIDNLMGLDLAFNNFCRDFQLGGKKVFYNRSLVNEDEGGLLAPDDICQQLFVAVGDRMPDEGPLILEHNPELRVADNVAGIQAQLDYLSLKCGLGPKHYRFDGAVVTATQYIGDRQELVRNASKHCLLIRQALLGAVRMLLWAGKEVLGAPVEPDTGITVSFDDSVIVDRETRRQLDREDVAAGILQKYEYRMRWYGEDRISAQNALKTPKEELAQ